MSELPEVLALAEQDQADFLATFPEGAWEGHEQARVDARLDWLLEKLTDRKAQVRLNNEVADARKLAIEDWRQAENAKIESSISYFEFECRQLLPADSKDFEAQYGQKSRRLPFGTIGFRQSPAKVEVFDVEKALAWARLHKLDITIKETVSKTVLKKAIEHTEDPPDGFQLVPGSSDFFVRTDDLRKGAH